MKCLIFIMIVLFHIQLIGAQELSNTPHMMNNLSFFNPAFIGKDYYIKVNGQLNVFATDNSDRIYHQGALNFEHRLNKINSGISIQASQHEIGPFRKNSILVGYSYFIPLKKENQALRFGISGGLRNNQSSLVSLGNENFSITPNQLVLNTGIAYSSEYFNIGYSFMQVNGKHRWTENSLPFYSGHTIYTDYTFKVLRGKNTTLKSGLIVNFIDQSFDFYFINKLNFNHRLYLLAGFTNGAIYNYGYTLGIGFTFLDKYSLGYALEIRQLSNLVPSHKAYNNELIFGYHLNKKQSKHKNTIGTPTF